MRICIVSILLFFVVSGCFQSIQARIIRVPEQINTIQTAIDESDNGDTVLVARGRYNERINFNGMSIIVMSNFTFTGDEEDILETIIDGSREEGSVVVVRSGESAVLTGFTVTGGFTDFGGAVYCRSSTATLSHLLVEQNTVARNGAGIYCTRNANVLIHDVIIRDNFAGYIGGGFSCFGGAEVTMRNVLIYNNKCDHVGGGLHCYGAELTLENVTVVGNFALHSAGALYVTQAGRVHVNNSIFWDNDPHEIYVMAGNDTTHVDIFFSDVDGGLDEVVDIDGANVEWGVGNIDVDPRFVDIDENNYRLDDDSPCIDAGHLEYDPDPDGTRRDIGMYYSHQDQGGSIVLHVPDDFDTIQDAIDEANDGDVVLVQPGEYFENIRLVSNITLGSKILSTGNRSYIDSTIIDGDGEGSVLSIVGDIPDALISGFTIQNGEFNFGGGIRCSGTNATLTNLLVQDNIAIQGGGGVYILNGGDDDLGFGPTLKHITVINNETFNDGGGIYISQVNDNDDETLLEDVQVIDNQARDIGGGLYITFSNPVLRDVIISNNSSSSAGGLHMQWSDPEFSRVLISENSSEGVGSAFNLWRSNPRMNNVTIASNTTEQNTDVIAIGEESHLELSNSIIWGNEPPDIRFFGEDNGISVHYSDIENGEDALIGNEEEFEVEWGEGNINVNPFFTNINTGDFSLAENSPCIDAGDPNAPRDPDATLADMGAFYAHQDFDYSRLFIVPDDYQTIQEAINVTQWGDSILVRPGRYEENININGHTIFLGSLFAITHDPAYIDSTIIDGGGNDVAVKFALGESGTLSGFRIENGSGREGGGIFIYNSSPTIEYCLITDNSAEEGGGGVFCYGSAPDFDNCTVTDNQAEEGAGGFQFENGAWVHISNSIIWGNEPEEIVFSADRDQNTLFVQYSALAGGIEGVITNFNGELNWDEGNIDQNPQFVDLENGDFNLTENSPCIDAAEPGWRVDPDGTPADIGAYYFDQGGEMVDFSIRLNAGWNVISSPVQPPLLNIDAIFSEIVDNGNLIIVKSQRGRFFRPDQEFNNINGWDVRYGYWVKVVEDDELIIVNRFVQEDLPIPLDEGWSIVSYFPERRVDVVLATEGIVDELNIIKDFHGRFYLPEYDFSNMTPLRRGSGYQVNVDDDIDLIWQTEGEERDGQFAGGSVYNFDDDASHYTVAATTPFNMSVLITEASAYGEDAEVGAFDKDGRCVGAVKLNDNGKTGLALWGDDPETEIVEGLRPGEQPALKVWFNGNEQDAEIEWSVNDGEYHSDSYAVGKLIFEISVPYEFVLHDPYPNPFNSTVRLKFSIPAADRITFSIYDISGRLVSQQERFYRAPGDYQIVLNADNWSSGLYFAELKAGSDVNMKKMVLLR